MQQGVVDQIVIHNGIAAAQRPQPAHGDKIGLPAPRAHQRDVPGFGIGRFAINGQRGAGQPAFKRFPQHLGTGRRIRAGRFYFGAHLIQVIQQRGKMGRQERFDLPLQPDGGSGAGAAGADANAQPPALYQCREQETAGGRVVHYIDRNPLRMAQRRNPPVERPVVCGCHHKAGGLPAVGAVQVGLGKGAQAAAHRQGGKFRTDYRRNNRQCRAVGQQLFGFAQRHGTAANQQPGPLC